jgi:hypothetical protein
VCDPDAWWGGDAANGWCFQAFGLMVDIPGHPKIANPSFNYVMASEAPVRAAIAGRVASLEPKDVDYVGPDEWTLLLEPHPGSAFSVEYDHLKGPTAGVGDAVEAGAAIGAGGRCQGCDQANAFIEVTLHYHPGANDGTNATACPTLHATPEFVARHERALEVHTMVFPDSIWSAPAPCVLDETR